MKEPLTFGAIARAARDRDPQLGELLVRYLAQNDPPPGAAEVDEETPAAASTDELEDEDEDLDDEDEDLGDEDEGDEDEYDHAPEVPAGAPTRHWLVSAVSDHALRGKTATERKLARREAWAAVLASRWAPPRLRLGELLLELYDRGDRDARMALVHVFREGRLGWGVWQAAKAIYKRAEVRHDAEMFGVLAYRFDVLTSTAYRKDEIGLGTIIYMRRRAWRWLRLLGQATPAAYPTFAVEVLRHYEQQRGRDSSWVAAHIWNHKGLIGVGRSATFEPPKSLKPRAFPEAWKISPVPLLDLLSQVGNDLVAEWAIRALEADHEAALRTIPPEWLARLGRRPLGLGAIHRFVVKLLRERPDLHMAGLRELGLHEMVLGLLASSVAEVRAYAIEYARAYAPDLPVATLVELATTGAKDVVDFVKDRLQALPPATIGLAALVRLLGADDVVALAMEKLKEGFRPADLDAALFATLATGTRRQRELVVKWFADSNVVIPAGHWIQVLADPRCDHQSRRAALDALGRRTAAEIGVGWLQQALDDHALADTVGRWLEAGMLAGDALDVEWVKSLVVKPRLRRLALALLGNRALVAPGRIGLPWLLDQARSGDEELHAFAHRMLLEHVAPEDFAPGGDRAAGLERIWALAAGAGSPEPVRAFAATYLEAHHPELGPNLAEAKSLGLTPRLSHDDYPAARVVPLLDDVRPDVRRLAARIAREELVRWGDRTLPYRLAAARHREARAIGCELLLGAVGLGEARLPAEWLDGARLFALTESPHKVTRETALTIIRAAYDRVGGAARLTWLMESPDRDVRLFAVRLFWDRHRPRAIPPGWRPPKDAGAVVHAEPVPGLAGGDDGEIAALRQFLRTALYGLPPGRLEQRDPIAGVMPERPLPASVAKRRLIETMRDLGIEDAGFAAVIAPVLGEFAESAARGEWQASVAALARLRERHPGLGLLGLPASRPPVHPSPASSRRPADASGVRGQR